MKLRAKGNKLKVEKVRGDRKKKKKNLPTKKQMKNIDLLHQHTTEALQAMEEEQKQSYSNTVSAWLILQYSKSLVNTMSLNNSPIQSLDYNAVFSPLFI